MMHDLAATAFPHAGVALAHAVARDDAALEARVRQIEDLASRERYPSGHVVPAVSRGFAAFERQDFSATIDALEPIIGDLERIGGSRAQLDLVEFTLLEAYFGSDRLDDAHRISKPDRLRPLSILTISELDVKTRRCFRDPIAIQLSDMNWPASWLTGQPVAGRSDCTSNDCFGRLNCQSSVGIGCVKLFPCSHSTAAPKIGRLR
jgi:hypothetical protein